jgi:hypothetical protein
MYKICCVPFHVILDQFSAKMLKKKVTEAARQRDESVFAYITMEMLKKRGCDGYGKA